MSITPIKIYEILLDHFGKQDWWPVQENYHKEQGSDPRFEIIVGAILTQNTAWVNVEKALFLAYLLKILDFRDNETSKR